MYFIFNSHTKHRNVNAWLTEIILEEIVNE